LVDDEKNILDTYCSLLSKKGFYVVTSDSAREARKEFFKNQFDLVITDLGMIDLGMTEDNGFALVEEIKEKSPDTPVIVFTGSTKTKILIEYLSLLGIYAIIEKGNSVKDFISCVMSSVCLKQE
jgi:DNA-binding NtrC family response regulator